MERYIPELKSLAAKKIAEMCRKMSKKDRYFFLKSIPKDCKRYIKAFPTCVVLWFKNQSLLNLKGLKFIKTNKNEILTEYEEQCRNGSFKKKFLRNCSNIYCENLTYGRMICNQSRLYFNLCADCRFPFYRFIHLKKEINK